MYISELQIWLIYYMFVITGQSAIYDCLAYVVP